MITSAPLTNTIGRIVNFYKKNENKLTDTYIRVASQKRFSTPSDNIADFFRSEKLIRDKNGYKQVRQELSKGMAMINVAEQAGTLVFDDVTRMKDLVEQYNDNSTTDDEKVRIQGEFNSLKTIAHSTITNTSFNGITLIQDTSATNPLMSINLDPNTIDTTYDVDFNNSQIATVSALDITIDEADALSDIQNELDKAGSYLAKVSGYRQGLNSQYNIVERKIVNQDENNANLSKIDSGREIAEMVERSINQQSSLAMLSQANMEKKKILLLFMQ